MNRTIEKNPYFVLDYEKNLPYPPFIKGRNLVEYLGKSPFEKGGFRGIFNRVIKAGEVI
jgi:hypothetical protein